MGAMKFNPEIYRIDNTGHSVGIFTKELPKAVDWKMIRQLVEAAECGGNQSIRLCLHDSSEALFHTMIIVDKGGTYHRPHKHMEKGECFHIIEGRMAIMTFDDEGVIADVCQLDPLETIMYRVAVNMYHAVIPLTPTVIYHESKPGPYLHEDDSVFPPWAPDMTDEVETARYHEYLLRVLE